MHTHLHVQLLQPCESGYYKSGTTDDTNCTACPLSGMVTPVAAVEAAQCACNPGYAPETQGSVLRCAALCGPGYRRPSFTSECEVCGPGTYTDEANAAECTLCPANTVSPSLSTQLSDCKCKVNYYSPGRERGTACLPCPE